MAVTRIEWFWLRTFVDGEALHTVEVNIPPARVGAQTELYAEIGGGAACTGIQHFRRRHQDGSDEDIDFGPFYWDWPAVIFDFVSSVTFALWIKDHEFGGLMARMDFWS